MQYALRGEIQANSVVGGATNGYRCDEIRLDMVDIMRLKQMARGGAEQQAVLAEMLDQWLCRFVPAGTPTFKGAPVVYDDTFIG